MTTTRSATEIWLIGNPKSDLNTGFEINACPLARGKLKLPRAKLFFGLACPTGKLTKYSILNNIKQDYLEMQFRSAFVAIK